MSPAWTEPSPAIIRVIVSLHHPSLVSEDHPCGFASWRPLVSPSASLLGLQEAWEEGLLRPMGKGVTGPPRRFPGNLAGLHLKVFRSGCPGFSLHMPRPCLPSGTLASSPPPRVGPEPLGRPVHSRSQDVKPLSSEPPIMHHRAGWLPDPAVLLGSGGAGSLPACTTRAEGRLSCRHPVTPSPSPAACRSV